MKYCLIALSLLQCKYCLEVKRKAIYRVTKIASLNNPNIDSLIAQLRRGREIVWGWCLAIPRD